MADAPTLYDLAREAGVSLATASRVVNGSARRVAEPYRLRVLEAAERIGYRANLSAQAVARGQSRMAALLVSDIADPFFSTIAAGVSRAAERARLLVSMSITGRDPERELELLRELRGVRPRLVILVGSRRGEEPHRGQLEAELRAFEAMGSCVVLVGAHELSFPSVRIDDAAGAAELGIALRGLGYRSFGVIGGPADLSTARERVAGFLSGVGDAPARVVHSDELTRDAGYAAAGELVSGRGDIDAIFAVTDVMAIGALTALRDRGIAVPEQVALAGFDDVPAARDAYPPLTTVHVDMLRLGERAVERALADSESDPGAGDEILATRVVLRASTAR